MPFQFSRKFFIYIGISLVSILLISGFIFGLIQYNNFRNKIKIVSGKDNEYELTGKLELGNIYFKKDSAGIRLADNDLEIKLTKADPETKPTTEISKDSDSITYKNISNGTSLKYSPLKNGIKEEVIIDSLDAIKNLPDISYSFLLNLKGFTTMADEEGYIFPTFHSKSNPNTTYTIPPAFMKDNKGETSLDVALIINKTDVEDEYNVQIIPDREWLLSESREFPIIIDPTIVKGNAPIAEWHIDEGFGSTLNDSSGNSNNLTITNATWQVKDPRAGSYVGAKSLKFDGSGDYLSSTYDSSYDFGSGSFSISMWFKMPTVAAGPDILLSRFNAAGFKVYMDANENICFGIDADGTWSPTDSACSTTTYNDANWHHIQAVKNSTTSIILYIDGVQAGSDLSTSADGSLSGTTPTLYFGIDSDGSSNSFQGEMDSITIYNYARDTYQVKADQLPSSQASATIGKSKNNVDNGLVAKYEMNDATWNGTSGEAIDSSGNANNGTSSGAVTTTSGKFGKGGSFDGVDDVVKVPTDPSISPTNQVSFAGWVRSTDGFSDTTTSVDQTIIDKGDYQFFLDKSDGKAKWVVNDNVAEVLEPLTSGGNQLNTYIDCMIEYQGKLYIGGSFVNAGGDPDADYIAVWDGNSFSWHEGITPNGRVREMVIWHNELYLVGSFTNLGGDADADYIAKYNGNGFEWPTGKQLNNYANELMVFNDQLWVGGAFTNAGGDSDADNMAIWDGSNFSWATGASHTMGSNIPAALENVNGIVYVGGSFANLGGDTDADSIAQYTVQDGFSWPSGQVVGGTYVEAFAVYENQLVVVGSFSNAGGDPDADTVAYWNGSSFNWPDGKSAAGSWLQSAYVFNGELYVGGSGSNLGGVANADYIGKWDGSNWSWPSASGLNSIVYAIGEYNGEIYLSGSFFGISNNTINYIAKFDGSSIIWPTSTTFNGRISDMAIYKDELYIAGDFVNAGGDTDADYIVKWDGTSLNWPSGQTPSSNIYKFDVWKGKLYAAGLFQNAGGDTDADYIAMWDGSSFSWPSGAGAVIGGSAINQFEHYNNELVAVGNFSNAGGDADADCIATWNETNWSWPTQNGGGCGAGIFHGAGVWKGELYIVGSFTDLGGDLDADRIAKWDSQASAYTWPDSQGLQNTTYSIVPWEDNLYVAGAFANAGGDADADYIAKWDGSSFSWPTGQTLSFSTNTLGVWKGNLYVTGQFSNAGGDADADYIAKWDGSSFSWPSGLQIISSNSAIKIIEYKGDQIIGGNMPENGFLMKVSSNNIHQVSSTSSNWAAGQWNHVAGSFDGNKLYMFVNGKLENSVLASTISGGFTINQSSRDLRIGSASGTYEGQSTQSFKGSLDDIRIYNRALSETDVRDLYNTPPGPVLYMDFNENAGTSTVYDKSGGGYTGTMNGSMTQNDWVPGRFGSALDFDGNNDGIEIADNDAFTSQTFTLSGWFKYNGTVSGSWAGNIISKGTHGTGQFALSINSDGALACHINGNNTNAAYGNVIDTNWHYAVCTYDGSTINFYYDGVKKTPISLTTTIPNSDDPINIGQDAMNNFYFPGRIDEVKVYNYVRSDAQIIEDMNGGHPVGGSPIGSQAGYWKFDQGYGTTVYDWSPQINNLTMSTASYSQDGKYRKAYQGVSNYRLSRADDDDFDFAAADNFTISTWVKRNTISNAEYLVYKESGNEGYSLSFDSDGDLVFGIGDVNSVSFPEESIGGSLSKNYDDNAWHHIAAVKTGTTSIKLFVDTIEVASDTSLATDDTLANGSTFYVADANGTDGTDEFLGLIDELKIYRAALTNDQIKTEYNRGSAISLGSTGTTSTGIGDSSGAREYCVPGDSSTCNAPLGEWKFDENTGSTANDSSGNGYASTAFNNINFDANDGWKLGKKGSAFQFDGSNDSVQVANSAFSLVGTSNFSLEAWVKIDSFRTSNDRIMTYQQNASNGYHLALVASNGGTCPSRFIFEVDEATTYTAAGCSGSNTILSLNRWYHVVGTYNDSTNTPLIYVDGVQQLGSTLKSLGLGVATTLTFASQSTAGTNMLDGYIDDAKIYNYVRTPAQVAWSYNRGAPVAWYKFDECSGAVINDWAVLGNGDYRGNNGTINLNGTPAGGVGSCTTPSTSWYNGVSGITGSSLDFDGNDYVNIGNVTLLNPVITGFSISSWAKATTWPSAVSTLVGKYTSGLNGEYYLAVYQQKARGVLVGTGGTKTSNSSATLVDGQWAHIVMTWSGVSGDPILIYVNGRLDTSTETNQSITAFSSASEATMIGARNAGASAYFTGQIDDTRIFDYALTPVQVRDVYNNGTAAFK